MRELPFQGGEPSHSPVFIQVFNRYSLPGGEESSVRRIASHLEIAGHRVIRFWRSSDEWKMPGAPSRFQQPFCMWHNTRVLEELRELHVANRPNAWILHNIVPVVSLGIYRLARQLGVPILQWLHNYRPLSPGGALRAWGKALQPEDPFLSLKEILAGTWHGRFLTAWLAAGYKLLRWRDDFSSVRAWIAVSEEMRKVFERGGFPSACLFTLRHSWDVDDPSPSARDDGYFLFLGRMIEEKGVRFLVNLWNDPALQSVPLVMAGHGPLADRLNQQSPPNVRWVGYVEGEAKKELIRKCRAIVFPVLWSEPLSTVAYEAYEKGKPIISSNLGGMKELVHDGETGRLLPAADSVAWRETILRFAKDAAYAHGMGLKGRAWLERNVSPAIWNRQFDAILKHALAT
jgi:glycosyltransferase involved in cell wall biosynthesis